MFDQEFDSAVKLIDANSIAKRLRTKHVRLALGQGL